MFPYLRSAKEFITDCGKPNEIDTCGSDSGKTAEKELFQWRKKHCDSCSKKPRLVIWLEDRITNAKGDNYVKVDEVVAWCQSVCRHMREVIRPLVEKQKDCFWIGLEYHLENSKSSRVRPDMIIGGYGKAKDAEANDCMKLMVVELKGYPDLASYNKKADEDRKQLEDYCFCLDWSINWGSEPEIEIIPCLYYHNVENPFNSSNSSKLTLERGNKKFHGYVFYKGGKEKFTEKIEETLNAQDLDPKEVFREVRQRYKTLDIGDFKKILGIQPGNYMDYIDFFRKDQQYIFEELKNHVKEVLNGAKIIDIIHGGPGSGKTFLAYMFKRYCEELNQKHDHKINTNIFFSRAAQYNALGLDSNEKNLYNIYYVEDVNKPIKDVVKSKEDHKSCSIYDEAHRYSNKEEPFNDIIDNSDYVLILYDEKQKLELEDKGVELIKALSTNSDDSRKQINRYYLWSQFRCNRDEGFVSWVEQVLEMEERNEDRPLLHNMGDDGAIYLSDLDFEVDVSAFREEDDFVNYFIEALEEKEINCVFVDNSYCGEFNTLIEGKGINSRINSKGVLLVHGIEFDEVFVVINQSEEKMEEIKAIRDKDFKSALRILMTRGLKECHIVFGPGYFSSDEQNWLYRNMEQYKTRNSSRG